MGQAREGDVEQQGDRQPGEGDLGCSRKVLFSCSSEQKNKPLAAVTFEKSVNSATPLADEHDGEKAHRGGNGPAKKCERWLQMIDDLCLRTVTQETTKLVDKPNV